jgi:Fe-S-cluster containining protein
MKELNRGDGVCKYLINNLCSIYEKRPYFCNSELLFKDSKIDKNKFIVEILNKCLLLTVINSEQQYTNKIISLIKEYNREL